MATTNDGDAPMGISSKYLEERVVSQSIYENEYALLFDEDTNEYVLVKKIDDCELDRETKELHDKYESNDKEFTADIDELVYSVEKGVIYGEKERYLFFIEALILMHFTIEVSISCSYMLRH